MLPGGANTACGKTVTAHAWHKMQRIRPSWTVIAFSGFAHEHYKIQDGGDQE